MRRGLSFIALAGFAALAGTAFANDVIRLDGTVDKGGTAVVKISDGRFEDGTATRRYRWKFSDLTVECAGTSHVARHPVTGGFEINAEFDRPGPWGTGGEIGGDPHDPAYATETSGRLLPSGRRAKGWVRVFGSEVPLADGAEAECDSGKLRWVARG